MHFVCTDIQMKDDNCIFCKLANGEIPTKSIYEDDMFRVILDASPASRGHALILPKEHFSNIYELSDEVASKVFVLAKKMAAHMTKTLGCDGFNVVQNNGEIAGQTVFHFHMHLIPRYENDHNSEKLCWNHENFSDAEMEKIKDLLTVAK